MIYALILVPIFTFILGGTGGYYLGRYQSKLLDKIRTLQEPPEPEEEPTVTPGVLAPEREISDNNRDVGLVEAKTPQRMEWETEQEIEKEGRGLKVS